MTKLSTLIDDDKCKIPADMVDGSVEFTWNADEPTVLCVQTSWGGACLDLTTLVKSAETITSLYLSPTSNPNCLIFEKEDGTTDCITGDELSRIISLTKLKDVDQSSEVVDGGCYTYNSTTGLFEVYPIKSYINDHENRLNNLRQYCVTLDTRLTTAEGKITVLEGKVSTLESKVATLESKVSTLESKVSTLESKVSTLESEVSNLKSRCSSLESRMSTAESNISTLQNNVSTLQSQMAQVLALLAKPSGAPSDISIAWGNINLYSDPAFNSTSSYSKTKGLYTHNLSTNVNGDELFG